MAKSDYTPEEMQRYRSERPTYDLPDEQVAQLLVFQVWLLSERIKDLGRVIAEQARKDMERIRGWVNRHG